MDLVSIASLRRICDIADVRAGDGGGDPSGGRDPIGGGPSGCPGGCPSDGGGGGDGGGTYCPSLVLPVHGYCIETFFFVKEIIVPQCL